MKPIFVFLALSLAFVGCVPKDQQKERHPNASPAAVNDYPEITLRLENGQEVLAKDLKGHNVFIMFHPDCDHCQQEAVSVEQRLEDFKDYTLYFISSAPMEQIAAFADNYGLDAKANVKFAWTATQGVLDNYGPIQTPSIYIYSDGRLKKYFNGQTDIESILTAL